MTYKALLVEDDTAIAAGVKLRLRSLQHQIDCAESMEEARDFLARSRYSYIILDLGLPITRDDPPEHLNGYNLLDEIVRGRGCERCNAVIILTGQKDDIELTVAVMQKGALDFVRKGVNPNKSEKTIDQVVKGMIDAGKIFPAPDEPLKLRPFPGGALLIHPDGYGIRPNESGAREFIIRRDRDSDSTMRKIMLLLLQRRNKEVKGDFSEEFLAGKVGMGEETQGRVRQKIHEFGKECVSILAGAGYSLGKSDVIQNDGKCGYSYHKDLEVLKTEVLLEDSCYAPSCAEAAGSDCKIPPHQAELPAKEQWILDYYGRGGKLSWSAVSGEFDGGKSTFHRCLTKLRQRELIP